MRAQFIRKTGFTLIEILTTVVIIGVLATAAMPLGQLMIIRQQESNLKQALSETRKAIDRFYADFKTYPASFIELRGAAENSNFTVSYMRNAPPVNPFTGDSYDWVVVTSGTTEYNPNGSWTEFRNGADETKFGCYETDIAYFTAHNVEVFQFEQLMIQKLQALVQLTTVPALTAQKIAEGKTSEQANAEANIDALNLALARDGNGKVSPERIQAEQDAINALKFSFKYFIPGPAGDPNNVYYWGIWDIKYPREDRIAINETLYKDW